MAALNTELAWLAGIIDGEGCITYHYGRSGRGRITPSVSINNTSASMVVNISRILRLEDIEFSMWYRIHKSKPKWRPSWVISIRRLKEIRKLLECVMSYLVNKQPQALLQLESIRLTDNIKLGDRNNIRIPYAKEIWKLNKTGIHNN